MKRTIVNTFGVFGYLSLIMQWLWSAVILATPLFSNEATRSIFLPEHTVQPASTSSLELPEPLAWLFIVLAIVFSAAVIIYAVMAVPRTIGKTGRTITTKSAKVIVPHVTHHKHISKKREKALTERITWVVKLVLVIVPFLLLLVPPDSTLGLTHLVTLSVGGFCAVASLVWFATQYISARLAKIDARFVW